MKAIGEVEKIIKDSLRKSEKELRDALIRPLSPEYQFSTNGVYFFHRQDGKWQELHDLEAHHDYGATIW